MERVTQNGPVLLLERKDRQTGGGGNHLFLGNTRECKSSSVRQPFYPTPDAFTATKRAVITLPEAALTSPASITAGSAHQRMVLGSKRRAFVVCPQFYNIGRGAGREPKVFSHL